MGLKFCCCNLDVQILQVKFNPSNCLALILQFQWMFRPRPVLFYSLCFFIVGTVKRTFLVSWVSSEVRQPLIDQPLRVTQIHYTGWPDYGAPSKTQDLLQLHSLMRKEQSEIQGNKTYNMWVSKTYRPSLACIIYKVLYVFLVSNWHVYGKFKTDYYYV